MSVLRTRSTSPSAASGARSCGPSGGRRTATPSSSTGHSWATRRRRPSSSSTCTGRGPMFAAGRRRVCRSWGRGTTTTWRGGSPSGLSDDNDLYAERLTGTGSRRYRFRGRVRSMSCRREVFRYRAGDGTKSVTEPLCRTLHGPVQARAASVAYARRYALWGREIETVTGLAALNDARNVGEVDRALRRVSWNENIIAADDAGHIGYWHPGLHPLRPRGWDERLPYPGTGEAEWRGLLPRS